MQKFLSITILLLTTVFPAVESAAQYPPGSNQAQVGVIVPMTITGGVLDTQRTRSDDPSAASLTAGFRVLAVPQLKLGSHWYFYSAIQVRSTPFFYDDAYRADRTIEVDMLQGFLGYTRSRGRATLGVKLGKITTAFGSFPLRYDDAENPLLDQPLNYTYLRLRPDQLPCGNSDFSPAVDVDFNCGGSSAESYGIQPATLYGIPGAEFDVSWRRVDARFQLTDSSPANPRSPTASGRHLQWTAGSGFTIQEGFRVGISAFRGPWLDDAVIPFLPTGASVTDFPASGLGIDAQWARGPWSASGEWQRFVFRYPNFPTAPRSSFGYIELKRIITPRWYAAFRGNFETNNHTGDSSGKSATTYLPNRQGYEIALGFRPNRFQLLKVGYEWAKVKGGPPVHDNVFGVQFVTSIQALSKAIK